MRASDERTLPDKPARCYRIIYPAPAGTLNGMVLRLESLPSGPVWEALPAVGQRPSRTNIHGGAAVASQARVLAYGPKVN